jgi:hypothetical protein
MVLSGSKIAPLMYDCQSDTAARVRFVPINADEHVDTVHPNLSVAAAQLLETMPVSRLFDDLFQLSDFLLDFPAYLFSNTRAFQVGIIRKFARLFLDLALHFVKPASCFVFRAFLHGCTPSIRFHLFAAAPNLSKTVRLQPLRTQFHFDGIGVN